MKIHVAAVRALMEKERQDETQFTTKIGGKTNLGCKILIPSYAFDVLLCQNWPFSPPNRMTLQTTLIFTLFLR